MNQFHLELTRPSRPDESFRGANDERCSDRLADHSIEQPCKIWKWPQNVHKKTNVFPLFLTPGSRLKRLPNPRRATRPHDVPGTVPRGKTRYTACRTGTGAATGSRKCAILKCHKTPGPVREA